jgi:hypothetical protein
VIGFTSRKIRSKPADSWLPYLTKVLPSLPLLLSVGFSSAAAIETRCAFPQEAHLSTEGNSRFLFPSFCSFHSSFRRFSSTSTHLKFSTARQTFPFLSSSITLIHLELPSASRAHREASGKNYFCAASLFPLFPEPSFSVVLGVPLIGSSIHFG